MGLEPGGDNGSFIQQVPLIGTTVVTASDLLVSLPSSEPLHFQFGLDFVATTDMDGSVRLSASDTVFVGYGISAPDLGWDDYKDVDVSGKTLVVLVNQPRALEQPSLTYYGRWTYKFEEATRRGAQAVLLVHTNATAGYPWSVVISSNSGEQIHLSRALTPALHTRDVLLSSLHEDDNAAKGLELKGWISSSAAELMARLSSNGTVGLEDWFRWAENRSFAPVALNLTVSQQSNYSTRAFFGRNVVGVLGGASAAAHESVVVSGHIDHLGVRNGKVSDYVSELCLVVFGGDRWVRWHWREWDGACMHNFACVRWRVGRYVILLVRHLARLALLCRCTPGIWTTPRVHRWC